MHHDTTNGRRIDERTDKHELGVETDAADRRETPTANSWSVDRRTFVKAGTLLGLTSGALGGVSAPVTAQAADPWSQQAKLLAADGAALDHFGEVVSIAGNGDTAIVGAEYDDDNGGASGSAYVFTRSSGTWIQQQKLTAADATAYDHFGRSVSLAGTGDIALVGAGTDDSGVVYVFTRANGTWTQQQKLTAVNGAANNGFGYSVSIAREGDTALVGTPGDDENGAISGAAYVFTRADGTWTQQAKLTAADGAAYDQFGWSVSLAGTGDTAIVGAYGDDNSNGTHSGSAYVFTRSSGTWIQQQKLTAADTAAYDEFGRSVSLTGTGDTALVGASYNDDNGVGSGSAYVFTRTGGTWTQQQKLTAADGDRGDGFGTSVSLAGNGDTALVGAYTDDSGAAYVFTRSDGTWIQQQKLTAADAAAGDVFGSAVSIARDGDTALIGADRNDDNGRNSGSAYVFTHHSADQPPTAAFSYTPTNPTVDEAVTFDASTSSDDSAIVAFEWEFGDGTTGTGQQTTHTYTAADDYTVMLTVTDDAGATATATQTVPVVADPANQPPMALFSYDPATPTVGEEVTFDASASSDDTTIESYTWEFGDGATGTGQLTTHTYTVEGDYDVVLTVTDDDGVSDTETVEITVQLVNQPPMASFSYSPATPEVGEAVTFDASASSDPNGAATIASYEWEFGDGTTGTGQLTTHNYTAEGDYEVRLTVTDDAGASETATQSVAVVVFADPLVVKGESYLPQDLDGDGLYEDITGDGAMTKEDSRALNAIIKAHRKGAVTLTDAQVAALDFNGDGHLSPSDKGAYKHRQKH